MKFLNSSYDPERGRATVEMQHLGHKFYGVAHAHPDEEYSSEFTGCYIAEMRATIDALKYERKIEKNKADMALDFIKACECYSNFDKNSPTAKAMYRQLNRRIAKVNNITDEINLHLLEIEKKITGKSKVESFIKAKRAEEENPNEEKI